MSKSIFQVDWAQFMQMEGEKSMEMTVNSNDQIEFILQITLV